MGSICPCIINKSQENNLLLHEYPVSKPALEECTKINAANIIIYHYKQYILSKKPETKLFQQKIMALPVHNKLVQLNISRFPPFVYNTILNKAPREFKFIQTLEGGALYIGYW